MDKGFCYGDKNGGNTYQGDIVDLTIDSTGTVRFKYVYTVGGSGGGTFAGRLEGDELGGMWDETVSGAPRQGKTDMRRETPVKLSHRFRGSYVQLVPLPSQPDDNGIWVIEFDL